MKYLDEFSNPGLARKLLDRIHAVTTRPWALMTEPRLRDLSRSRDVFGEIPFP